MSWTDATQAFKRNFNGYEERTPQTKLANAVETAMGDGEHALCEAPTGVGKSYVALVTGVDAAFATGLPTVAATGTKALQDQYIRDLETLSRIWRPFRFALLKGRSNYACLAKLADLDNSAVSFDLSALKAELDDAAATGDIDQLTTAVGPYDRPKITSTSEECPGRSQCPFGQECFSFAARERAANAHIVVANHALFATDAALHEGTENTAGMVLPEYGHLIIDEAHTLEDSATSAVTKAITEGGIDRALREASTFTENVDVHADAVAPLRAFFGKLAEVLPYQLDRRTQKPVMRDGEPVREKTAVITPEMLVQLVDEHGAVLDRLTAAQTAVRRVPAFDPTSESKRDRLVRRLKGQVDRLTNIVLADFESMVRWIETDDNGRVSIQYTRLDIGNLLRETVWNHHQTTFLSATLAMRKKGQPNFAFVASRLGLETGTYRTCVTDHVFDYPSQARTFVPPKDSMDAGQKQSHSNEAMIATKEMVVAAGGRALLLYTSRAEMESAYRLISPVLSGIGIACLKQGQMPNRQLSKMFAEDETSVLFALKSFFTGFDVRGDALRLVVINKLPFPHPGDIVFKAKCDVIDAHASGFADGAFMKLTVPTMALEILQGYGRLIRSMSDQGVVAILDSRLRTKSSYGRVILDALPPAPITDSLAATCNYLRELQRIPAAV